MQNPDNFGPKEKNVTGDDKGHAPDTQPDPHYTDGVIKKPTGDPETQDGAEPEDLDNDAENI